jgi:hypothetical protein
VPLGFDLLCSSFGKAALPRSLGVACYESS